MGEEIATSANPPRRLPGARSRAVSLIAVAAVALGASACGSEPRQDAEEPSANFPVEVTAAKFATDQRLAQTSDLRLAIENTGDETVPDLAVTIYTGDEKASGPFQIRSQQPGLADPNRPVWILENEYPKLIAPGVGKGDLDTAPSAGAEAAQTDTFSFGPVAPGESKDIVWRLTPIQAGTYTVHYELAAGLHGEAKAVTKDGGPVEGEFVVTISDKPPRASVSGSGKVVVEGE